MGDAKEDVVEQMIGFPRDLLQRFTAGNHRPNEFASTSEDNEEIELNLGLSLGGCFGVDPEEKKKLIRSSSIAGFMITPVREDDGSAPLPIGSPAIMRASSLPTEIEEEQRKRKEMQTLRRMEAKRKRSEKQRNFRAGKDRASLESNCEEDKRPEDEGVMAINLKGKLESFTDSLVGKQQQKYMVKNGLSPSVGPPLVLPTWAAAARLAVLAGGINTKNGKESSQGSVGSQGSSSSGISEFDSLPVPGLSNCTEVRSPSSIQSLPEQSQQKPVVTLGTSTSAKSSKFAGVEMENPSKKPKVVEDGVMEMGKNMMEEMPCVSTRGDGPNGRRVEGFLYKYRKGEEVRIVCVCHGSFLSPAEFVKHAGGGDVAHPLRHIVVSPSSCSSSFL
ncbi:hypothetical protein HHK36_015471 [Tetracentron sinense]|uniref:Ninja-family protein n=1 Tax=Tetracentron sinense TaxID=13715 RepID=A0A835DG69_TETSI|nr:hypothetical protein HHK36_015471 [Tetracentron sinense]